MSATRIAPLLPLAALLWALLFQALGGASPVEAAAFFAAPPAYRRHGRAGAAALFRSTGSAASTSVVVAAGGATTIEAPTRERTSEDTSTRRREDSSVGDDHGDDAEYPDLEYLQDYQESRELDDPFHILLLGSTFEKPKITVAYVSGSLEYVLGMPTTEAKELSRFARDEGFSCLGTWSREECLTLGRQLQVRDLVCRVVPFAEGGQRGWQAKDAAADASSRSSSSSRSGSDW